MIGFSFDLSGWLIPNLNTIYYKETKAARKDYIATVPASHPHPLNQRTYFWIILNLAIGVKLKTSMHYNMLISIL